MTNANNTQAGTTKLSAAMTERTPIYPMQGSLSDMLVGVRLQQSFWSAEANDRQTSAEVEQDKQAKSGTIKKTAIDLVGGSEAYKVAQYHKGQLYQTYQMYTFPWEDRGGRAANGMKIMEVMEILREQLALSDEANRVFCDEEYPTLYERAMFEAGGNNLGALASRVMSKYPSPAEIHSKFNNKLTVYPISSSQTLARFGKVFTEQDMAEIVAMEQEREKQVQADAWRKMAKPIEALANKCIEGGKRWHESTIQNVRDVISTLHVININNDPVLNKIADDALALLSGIDKEALKEDDALRSSTGAKAKELIARMQGYM